MRIVTFTVLATITSSGCATLLKDCHRGPAVRTWVASILSGYFLRTSWLGGMTAGFFGDRAIGSRSVVLQ